MKSLIWNSIISFIHAIFSLTVFLVLFVIEFVFTTLFIGDSNPVPTTGEYVFLMILTILKCVVTVLFLLLQKETSFYKVLVSLGVGIVTALWLILLIAGLHSHVYEVRNAPKLLLVCDFIATSLCIVVACLLTLIKLVKWRKIFLGK
ncbi:hypothetical protein PP175_19650 [Aneurinibacillus sp. Ricciae_BoGa-3]|uniref:hypothetical protein n=1 Tax=Aneurinibacillus sp. Ricciae_BoGa-3 TaxID=3022697 RepID=UPI00234101E7|nr:hypothetical protein [Aneurinibacillus sp. Ricciae_BoGa-3]WCK53531.1 hypothetical protein PP175_19650 [Aneurinibacillus sp. Ricciae_BoGa-3]